jgi:hypothetical protein
MIVRSQSGYQNSRACLDHRSCRMVHWHWALKESRMLSRALMTRMPQFFMPFAFLTYVHDHAPLFRRKSDIENERLPPDLVDADSAEGRAYISSSLPQTPGEDSQSNDEVPPSGVAAALEEALSSAPSSPIGPPSPSSGSGPSMPFRRGHGRQASLGTTMTSPSTRRRSIESTMSLLKEAVDGKEDADYEQLADQVAGKGKEAKENAMPAR